MSNLSKILEINYVYKLFFLDINGLDFFFVELLIRSNLRSSFSAFPHEKSFVLVRVGPAPEGQIAIVVQRVRCVPDAHVALQCMT